MPKIAVQTFTVRKHLKSPAAIEQTFEQFHSMGINAVELARIKWSAAEIDAVERVTKKLGMVVGSTQNTFDYLSKNFDWSVKLHKQLNCQYVVVSVLPMRCILGSEETLSEFAFELEKLGRAYRQQGLRLLFHHHHFEFQQYGDELGFDILMNSTSPENVGLVLDTYWLQRGGKTPQDVIIEYANRVEVVHLRDYKIHWKLLDLLPMDAALGEGNLDFRKIIESCKKANVAFMAIEQETKTPFESLTQSINHIKELKYTDLF